MLLVIPLLLLFLNAISLLEAGFILGDFNSPNALAMASIELFMVGGGVLIILLAVVIQIVQDKNKEIHIPEMNHCIELSAVGLHMLLHVLPLIAAIRYAWYTATLPSKDEFLIHYGVILGAAASATLGSVLAIYAVLEIHAIQKMLDVSISEVRKKNNMPKKSTV